MRTKSGKNCLHILAMACNFKLMNKVLKLKQIHDEVEGVLSAKDAKESSMPIHMLLNNPRNYSV